jgi:hypothetical protein
MPARLVTACLVLCLLLLAPGHAAAPTITVTGSATFPSITLTGDVVSNTGLSATPAFRIRSNSNNAGFHVTLQSSNFVNGASTIPAASLRFAASGGTLTRNSGNFINATNGPRETGNAGTLDTALKCVTCNAGYGKGSYTWTPNAGNFSLDIPATALAGTYSATLTATVTTGP